MAAILEFFQYFFLNGDIKIDKCKNLLEFLDWKGTSCEFFPVAVVSQTVRAFFVMRATTASDAARALVWPRRAHWDERFLFWKLKKAQLLSVLGAFKVCGRFFVNVSRVSRNYATTARDEGLSYVRTCSPSHAERNGFGILSISRFLSELRPF